jgi:hypothetical protein
MHVDASFYPQTPIPLNKLQANHGYTPALAPGVTKRERFALEIFCALLMSRSAPVGLDRETLVDLSVTFADLLIERTVY